MSVENNKETVRRYIDALSDPTGESTAMLLGDSAAIQIRTRSSEHPLPQTMTKEQYLEFRRNRLPNFLPNGVRHEIRSMLGEGDWVSAETECFADLRNGQVYNNVFHVLFKLRDGHIEVTREHADFLYAKQILFTSANQT